MSLSVRKAEYSGNRRALSLQTRLILILLFSIFTSAVYADVFRPAYLELRELDQDNYQVMWKVPSPGSGTRLSAYVRLPEGTVDVTEPRVTEVEGAWIESWQVSFQGGLVGQVISIEGRAVGVTDVIARVERLDGSSQVERLPIDDPQFTVEAAAGKGEVAWAYLVLGVEHILGGIDHLLFVLALLLIVRGARRIFATVTAFTIAHSITLVAASLGWMYMPGPPVEAIIALSIVFVAAEAVHGLRGQPGITARAPWIVAFSFGLLHGFGFAGALAEIGLPQNAIPVALFTFNVGVELGQLLFIAVVLSLSWVYVRFFSRPGVKFQWVTAYSIGTVATFWTVERIVSFWTY
jgi:hydrogenase/urease accessory protein HupE